MVAANEIAHDRNCQRRASPTTDTANDGRVREELEEGGEVLGQRDRRGKEREGTQERWKGESGRVADEVAGMERIGSWERRGDG